MLIHEILNESAYEDLVGEVQTQLARLMSAETEEISTTEFQQILAAQGYNISIPELIQAVDQSGFASSVNDTTITPANQLSGDVDTEEDLPDLDKKANTKAMSDIKSKGSEVELGDFGESIEESNYYSRVKGIDEAVEKIACLKCDEVSTSKAWKANDNFCPKCDSSQNGVRVDEANEDVTNWLERLKCRRYS